MELLVLMFALLAGGGAYFSGQEDKQTQAPRVVEVPKRIYKQEKPATVNPVVERCAQVTEGNNLALSCSLEYQRQETIYKNL